MTNKNISNILKINDLEIDIKLYPRKWIRSEHSLSYIDFSSNGERVYPSETRVFQNDQSSYSLQKLIDRIKNDNILKDIPFDNLILFQDEYSYDDGHSHSIGVLREETDKEYYERVKDLMERDKEREEYQYKQFVELKKKFEK